MDTLDEFVSEVEKMNAEMKENGGKALRSTFKKIFERHSDLVMFKWTQYTPYFNDGSECVFRVGELEAEMANGDDPTSWSKQDQYKELYKELNALGSSLYKVKDMLKLVFGDHSKITVTPKAIKVEEYEHD